jgi:hypothetical protein
MTQLQCAQPERHWKVLLLHHIAGAQISSGCYQLLQSTSDKRLVVALAQLLNVNCVMSAGLEVIEAHYLFGASYDDIEIVIHPQVRR